MSGKSHPDTSTVSPEERGNPEGRDFSRLQVDYEKRESDKSRRRELLAIRNFWQCPCDSKRCESGTSQENGEDKNTTFSHGTAPKHLIDSYAASIRQQPWWWICPKRKLDGSR
jgi:hypothetical protein